MNKYSKNDSSSGGNIEDVEQQGLEPILSHEAELTHPLASFGQSRFSFFFKGGRVQFPTERQSFRNSPPVGESGSLV
jgi:hypothetical protein